MINNLLKSYETGPSCIGATVARLVKPFSFNGKVVGLKVEVSLGKTLSLKLLLMDELSTLPPLGV